MASEPSGNDHEVVGVFRDERSAAAAADAARRAGADWSRIRVGERGDELVSLRGEMREEMDRTMVGPGNVGPFTKEMGRTLRLSVPIAALAGAVLALPLGFIPVAGLSLLSRLIIAAIVGAVAGSTLGFVLGGGFGAKDPGEKLGAERGITVGVRTQDRGQAERIASAMAEHQPIRVDTTTGAGQPIATPTTEEEQDERP